jgi:hypothetical protein
MIEWRRAGEAALKKRLQQAQREGEPPSDTAPADFARNLSAVRTGLGIQAVNGPTKAEMKRIADIAILNLNGVRITAHRTRPLHTPLLSAFFASEFSPLALAGGVAKAATCVECLATHFPSIQVHRAP